MTHRLLSTLVVAAVATSCTFSAASACDKNKNSASAATSKSKTTTAAVASTQSTAAAASMDHCLMPTVASTSVSSACATKMSAAECAAKMAAGECVPGKSANAVMASSKGADECCMSSASKSAKSAKGGAKSGTSANTGVDAVLVGGPGCSAHKSTGQSTMAHADCDNCSDLVMCEGQLKGAQASMQVVPLKNGVMYVYTASGAKNVRTVQTAIARHTERIAAVSTANGAKLCPECKALRGAAASGKLGREVVNIEGGCLTLVTSNDPAIVNKIYTMAGLPSNTAARVKS